MAFDPGRVDRARLARVPFGESWLALADPTQTGSCDPFDVRDRLALYRLLVERGHAHGAFGAHDELSPFWGYASQLAWQAASGRLGGAAGSTTIDEASWWGACNYALSVVPYVAAAELGAVPTLRLPPPAAAYAPALAAWRGAFAVTRAPRVDHDRVRVAVWRAHLVSIGIAVERHRAEHAALPAAERAFARGWVRMVDLFGAAAIRTDLARLADVGAGSLPPRVLDGPLDDLTRHERSTVRRVSALAAQPHWRWRAGVAAWRRVMRSRTARAEAEDLLAELLGGRGGWPVRLRALAYATLPVRVLDAALTTPPPP